MEKNTITCSKCGRSLAHYIGKAGEPRRLKLCERVRVQIQKNALGEDLGWMQCPHCKINQRFDSIYWLGDRRGDRNF